jgi:predicted Zn finger-like uncharacterized protein
MREKVKCPYCGANTAVEREKEALSKGLWVRCKKCKKEFEIKIDK